MGVCQSVALSKEQYRLSQKIETDLKDTDFRKFIKLLLLGSGESGKSTILKQLRLLHDNKFTPEELKQRAPHIFCNTVQSMAAILVAMHDFRIPLESTNNEPYAKAIVELVKQNEDGEAFDQLTVIALKALWADGGVRRCYERRAEFQLNDTAKYLVVVEPNGVNPRQAELVVKRISFLDAVDRTSQPNYVPSVQDVLYTRVATIGAVQTAFTFKNARFRCALLRITSNIYRVIDVGGQRSQRRKWIHHFDDMNAVIFIAAVSDYNLTLRENSDINRMDDTLRLFDGICNSSWFSKAAMILFLNKTDIFAEKIKSIPICCAFPDYNGPADFVCCMNFIQETFEELNHDETNRVYVHWTCATDTNQVQLVLHDIIDMLTQNNANNMLLS